MTQHEKNTRSKDPATAKKEKKNRENRDKSDLSDDSEGSGLDDFIELDDGDSLMLDSVDDCDTLSERGRLEIEMPGLDENPKFNKNELVWAKVRGHAWWPGRVGNVQMELLPRMKRPEYTYEVHFLEDDSHCKLIAKNVMSFYENFHKLAFTTKTKKRASKAICKAIKCYLKQRGKFDIERDVRQKFEELYEERAILKKE
jgi:hypothetical protein